ncbi:hypothetical protein BV25DRAFT_1917562 [Artomyces pyxidatus]|uniref:Uncharacterized protein n=1 Tax=Artomyces pyxidatus TaxID=48021 RepID=A0ACB8SYG1_9AGAM|nr:hypothetical protein BV25DRAFT_1917562 [Artomyces pyxidatus]
MSVHQSLTTSAGNPLSQPSFQAMDAAATRIESESVAGGANCYIARVPYEILQKILLHLRLFSLKESEDRPSKNPPAGIAIYHVCKLWRRVVRETPKLWKTIPLHIHGWALCALAFSKNTPISIHVNLGRLRRSAGYRKTVKEALLHVSRTRVLSFTWNRESLSESGFKLGADYVNHLQDITDMLVKFDAPLLEKFVFLDLPMNPVFMQDIPDGIFRDGPLPRLRLLFLAHVEIPSKSPLLQGPLVSLEISGCTIFDEDDEVVQDEDEDEERDEGRVGPSTSLENTLEALRGLPTLETLTIRYMRWKSLDDFDGVAYPQRGIALPNLKELVAIGDLDDLLNLIQCLSLPIGIDLNIDCHRGHDTNHMMPFLPDAHTPIALMLHCALYDGVEAGLSFQDIHVAFHHIASANMDVLHIDTSNPYPLERPAREGEPAPDPTTRMRLTLRHHQQPWLATDIMAKHAAMLLHMVPAIDHLRRISTDGWVIPAKIRRAMGLDEETEPES